MSPESSSANFTVWPGVPYPLGATLDGNGVNFAVYSESATAMYLCLFDPQDPLREIARLPLADQTNHVFHGYVPQLPEGSLYGFRADGPWAPERGLRFNLAKLLVDPYARAISGQVDWKQPIHGHVVGAPKEIADPRDSSAGVPRSVVTRDAFDWSDDKKPEVLWRKAIVYELHVKGFTRTLAGIPEHLRGTYAGLAHPVAIDHLKSLGVTTVELLPVHESASEGFLVERGQSNYWGYNTLGFFAPDQRFSSSGTRGQQIVEFKNLIKALHQAGIEVILDVVYNHTCEGNHLGPTLSFRGLDNPTYYWAEASNPARYRDFTGCGNSLDASHPQTLKLMLDSLRYWVSDMHVDGFRFDLAPTLARTADGEFSRRSEFFSAVYQDPILSRVKLIAEPWDVGPNGYRVGEFPLLFAEWNDRYRHTLRRFWRGDPGQLADLGYRLSGSSDFFRASGRRPSASVNFVTCHDGFTLNDLVSFSQKHNEANGEENRDGSGENHSANWGVEGVTDDPHVLALRDRMKRNFIASLFLSVGTPMLLAGDEFGRTQNGNNNAYCQDNALGWLSWNHSDRDAALLDFTRQCIALRQSQPVLQRRNFFHGGTLDQSKYRDLVWYHPDGREMERADWEKASQKCLGIFLGGDAITARSPTGVRVTGDTLLAYFNADAVAIDALLPRVSGGEQWELLLDTVYEKTEALTLAAGSHTTLPARSIRVFRQKASTSVTSG